MHLCTFSPFVIALTGKSLHALLLPVVDIEVLQSVELLLHIDFTLIPMLF